MFENWEAQPTYPQYTQDDSGYVATLRYMAPKDYIASGMPERFTPFPVDRFSFLIFLEHLTLRNIAVAMSQNGNYAYVTLVFREPGSSSSSLPEREDGKTIYSLSAGTIEKPIETHPSYKTKWNHYLCKKSGTKEPAPDVNTSTADIGDREEWRWYRDLSEMPTGWIKHTSRTKPGVEAYALASPIVHRKSYYKQQSSANNTGAKVGTISTPGNRFGKSGQWFVSGGNVYFEDGFWVAELDYQFSDQIDSELY